jgi:hypothetical protein
MMNHALKAVACARYLPAPLIQARATVFHPENCQDLNGTARRVLYGILTFMSLKFPTKAIFPRRCTLMAESLLQSESTLYRGLCWLEKKGYITRDQIRKARNGKFHLSPITLTEKALVLLGLGGLIHRYPSTKTEDGHIKKELTNDQQSLKNTTAEQVDSKKTGIDRTTGLPHALTPLLGLSVEKSAICWLMKMARGKGKRLEHVMKTVWHCIEGLKGREVVGYLKSMLAKDLDYAWIVQEKEGERRVGEREAALRRVLESIDERQHGFQVVSSTGVLLGVLEIDRSGPGIIRSQKGSAPLNYRFAEAIIEGEIVLRPAHGVREGCFEEMSDE